MQVKVLLMGQQDTYLGNVLVSQGSAFKGQVNIHSSKKNSIKTIPIKLGYTYLILYPGHSMHSLTSLNHTS